MYIIAAHKRDSHKMQINCIASRLIFANEFLHFSSLFLEANRQEKKTCKTRFYKTECGVLHAEKDNACYRCKGTVSKVHVVRLLPIKFRLQSIILTQNCEIKLCCLSSSSIALCFVWLLLDYVGRSSSPLLKLFSVYTFTERRNE